MRRLSIVLAVCTLALVFCPTGTAFAQEPVELPAPGVTPDSPFYCFDELAEQIALRFTFREEIRAEKALHYAEERLAEMNYMMARNNMRAAIQAMNGYTHYIDTAMEAVAASRNRSQTQTMMALALTRHNDVFDTVSGEISGEARQAMIQTRERARICQQAVLHLLEQEDPKTANQVRLMLTERQRNSVGAATGEDESTSVEETLEEALLAPAQGNTAQAMHGQGQDEEPPGSGLGAQTQNGDNNQNRVNNALGPDDSNNDDDVDEPSGGGVGSEDSPHNSKGKVSGK